MFRKLIALVLLAGFSPLLFHGETERVETVYAPEAGEVKKVYVEKGSLVYSGDPLVEVKNARNRLITIRSGVSGTVVSVKAEKFMKIGAGGELLAVSAAAFVVEKDQQPRPAENQSYAQLFAKLYQTTGLAALLSLGSHSWIEGWGRVLMYLVGLLLLFLGISKKFEPLLLVPIAVGCLLSNIPLAGIAEVGGLLHYTFEFGVGTGIFPLLIFLGVGAMTDFGPLIASPSLAFLGASAQIGIFATIFGALLLNGVPGIEFSLSDAAAIGIIGGADGPTSIFVASKLAPGLLGSIAVAAYSYMALVPVIQPPIAKLLTTEKERKIKMVQLRYVSKREKILFPVVVTTLCALLLPSSIPLVGMLMFGNLLRESGVTARLSDTAQNALINVVTIFLGLSVGTKLTADKFLNAETIGILLLGMVAFMIGTAGGVIIAKLMNKFRKEPINPIIGIAGVSAVPMAARVANKLGSDEDPQNFLLMHAMGPNVAGVIGSAIAASILITFV